MPPFEIQPEPGAVRLHLRGDVTIQDAAALHAALLPALAGGLPLVIEAGELTRLDTAATQVVIAAIRTSPGARLQAASAAWADSFRRHALPDPAPQT